MIVYLEDPEYIGVDLDDGTHVSSWCVVEDGEAERDALEKHLQMIIDEAVAANLHTLKAENERLKTGRTFAPSGLWRIEYLNLRLQLSAVIKKLESRVEFMRGALRQRAKELDVLRTQRDAAHSALENIREGFTVSGHCLRAGCGNVRSSEYEGWLLCKPCGDARLRDGHDWCPTGKWLATARDTSGRGEVGE
jgi:hypothetical protein